MNSGAAFAGDGVINREELGYGTAGNNLEIGGEALVKAGFDPNRSMEGADSTPIEIAKRSRAIQFLMKMQDLGYYE